MVSLYSSISPMMKQTRRLALPFVLSQLPILPKFSEVHTSLCCNTITSAAKALSLSRQRALRIISCRARRRVRYDDDEDYAEEEGYGYNQEIAMLELYSKSAKEEALLVQALVGEDEVQVLIFKGFSSCLNYRTSPDPSRSVLSAKAVIKSIDRIKGPFDPSNIEYLEKGLPWETFKTRLAPI